MKCFSEEEQEELDAINERMSELEFDKSEREQEINTKLKEPDIDEDTTIQKSNLYKHPTKRVMSTLAAISAYASPYFGSKRKPYVCDYERVNVKGEPGTYDKSKHLSRAQRKRLKQKSLKKKS